MRNGTTLHVLPGGPSLSDFRVQRLVEQLRTRAPGLRALQVLDLFLVSAAGGDAASLRRLLGSGPDTLPTADLTLLVVPRLGTTSPWCSKATDIARVCGMAHVERIERGRAYLFYGIKELAAADREALYDRMTESLLVGDAALSRVFDAQPRRPLRTVDVIGLGRGALDNANKEWGLALSDPEMNYLATHFRTAGRNPTDAELMMFAQINSEHCRHKIFNAEFSVDGERQKQSLFELIKLTHKASPFGVLSAYRDNAAVVEGPTAMRFFSDADRVWRPHDEPVHLLMKVETHNHPTGISPHPGAATGAGGEIRDESATGRGAHPKAGLCGFTVANLRIPGFEHTWEIPDGRPPSMASALSIMLEGPIGAAAYNNEFGRPNLAGYFRTFEMKLPDGARVGYHKPIMIAGGFGNIRDAHVHKGNVPVGAKLVVLGGPAMLIGLGGGAASSMATGASAAELDFASVQRANPELERRCQEVIDACWALGDANPILSIHDVGAGGLSNALPELVHADARGGTIRLRAIASADPALSPMEIWCNEAQERYVLAIAEGSVALLETICRRERCPVAVVGAAVAETLLTVADENSKDLVVQMPMPVLLGKAPRLNRTARRATRALPPFRHREVDIVDAAQRVLRLPCVAGKSFLITIGDRTVGGLTVRDQMVGPWQVPVADCAVTATGFTSVTGEAMAMGERPILALVNAPASGRMAVGEAITNIAAARIGKLSDIKLSANWMAAAGQGDEDARLYDAVRAVGAELCPMLGICIPVGKDSLSMRTVWKQGTESRLQTAPLSLIVSAFATVTDVRRSLTPQLKTDRGATRLLLIDLGRGKNRLGGSALAQVFGAVGTEVPDLDDPALLKRAFAAVQQLNEAGLIQAYHDRSDGGLFATLCEMAFAGRCGVDVELDVLGDDPVAALFTEELGIVLQLHADDVAQAQDVLGRAGLDALDIGAPATHDDVRVTYRERESFREPRAKLHQAWAETSFRIAQLRDEPACTREEFESVGAASDPGLSVKLTFDPKGPAPAAGKAPRVAILREQGVNGQAEMAYAFHAAGFAPVDVHMTDILEGRVKLDDFAGLVACGGFSYGDVLGAGQGWAKSILFHEQARAQFATFLARKDRFALGVCNGCQMFAALKEIVPGAAAWPVFLRNRSEQFEARWSMVEVAESRSLFWAGMAGSRLPIAVAHGEGRATFLGHDDAAALATGSQVGLRFVDNAGAIATRYPQNPNGSPGGVTGLTTPDGRFTILMPHPERAFRSVQLSWRPEAWGEESPWMRMFRNARSWTDR